MCVNRTLLQLVGRLQAPATETHLKRKARNGLR